MGVSTRRDVTRASVAREAIMIVISQMAMERRKVRAIGLKNKEGDTYFQKIYYRTFNHCRFCAFWFRDPEAVWEHYCVRHADRLPHINCQLIR